MRKILILSAITIAITGCAAYPESGYNTGYNAPTTAYDSRYQPAPNYYLDQRAVVRPAVIEDVRFSQGGNPSGAGAAIGAIAGGVLGNQIGSGGGRTAATVIGALGGGFAGNEVERRGYRQDTVQIQLRALDNGEILNVTQKYSGEDFRPGRRVQLVNADGRWMVRY